MSLAVSGYMRQFYKGNLFGASASGRNGQPSHSLLSADLKAVRRAVQGLSDYDYDDKESDGEELVNKVAAFVSTYNNLVDSAKGTDDEDLDRYMKQLKKLSKDHAEELADIGITVQSSGKLKIDDRTLKSTGRYQVSKLFASDAEYGKGVENQIKNTNRMVLRNRLNVPKRSTSVSAVETQPPQTDGSDGPVQGTAPDTEDQKLARQLVQALAGSVVNYSV